MATAVPRWHATARFDDARTARSAIVDRVTAAVERSFHACDCQVILAVSGGLDSMVLLDAASRALPDAVTAVATFDHASGPHARVATDFVRREAERRGLRTLVGRAHRAEQTEAGWRAARWDFLRETARDEGARVATAHSADDHVETVCMRILRGSGARGLAGLHARSGVLRPLLDFSRGDLTGYAAAAGVEYLEDPTNSSVAFFRNRVRRDLLPAIARVQPEFANEMRRLSGEAAVVRNTLDGIAEMLSTRSPRGGIEIELAILGEMGPKGLAALAPALAARAGVVLDRRGTTRLSEFILSGRTGARIQLSGAAEVVRSRDRIAIRRTVIPVAPGSVAALSNATVIGRWRLRRVEDVDPNDLWAAPLPADQALTVRGWRAGDRMRAAGSRAARRVKRFFSDAGIPGPERAGWPVVLVDGEIVWIPGVRRSDAATDRSGRPVLRYRCERNDV